MICVVIKGPSFQEAQEQISKALAHADLVELCLTYFTTLDLDALKVLRSRFSIPMIFTLRNPTQSEIHSLLELRPEYLDWENHFLPDFIHEISTQYPETKLILSYHNFIETPEDLEGLYQTMQKTPAFFYKIAVTAKNCLDTLRFMCFKKKSDDKLIAVSMGPHGQISRILGPVIGSPITYASLEDNLKSAPGQFTAKTLIERYRYRTLNPHTKIYGLIGDPVDQSISDETHNALMASCGLNAVYVKIQVPPSELTEFLLFAKQLPFHGFSVTMPLKEHILSCLDKIDPQALEIGAVNTLLFEKDKILGWNTDGEGALNALENESPVRGKHIIILGAGGSARAIAYEAIQRGAFVTILNRDAEKAIQLARHLHCEGKGLDSIESCWEAGYDILINCTPTSLPIPLKYLLSQATFMDIRTKPKEAALLAHAQEIGCKVIYGYQMFIEQALGQFHLWFQGLIHQQNSKKILQETCIKSMSLFPCNASTNS